ncbi:MAG: carotenoid oxygenase family protein [Thainema sp.]
MTQSMSANWPPFPLAMMQARDAELSDLQLNVVAGALPTDISGHAFIVAPVGSVTSNGLPNPSGTHIWNGNGLIYRLDFDQPGQVNLTTRLAKSPCYYADVATRPGSRFEHYQFQDHGMARFSPKLGMRDELNTAFVPMQFGGNQSTRLAITFDGGRPYEIDPVSLAVVTPVGSNQEWRPGAKLGVPFAPVLSTAHPAFDGVTGQFFTVNYGRSLTNFIETIPAIYDLDVLPHELEELLRQIAAFFNDQWIVQILFSPLRALGQWVIDGIQAVFAQLLGVEDFVYLIRWDGEGDVERWRLILPDGRPVRIEQTMHQIAVSRDYVVIMDTCLKFGLEQILNNPLPDSLPTERLLRSLLTRPQSPNTKLYIVHRNQLTMGQHPARQEAEVKVVAYPLEIPLETAHFLADYDNAKGQLTLHMAHECATDVSEWVRRYDQSAYDPSQPLNAALEGMIAVGAMDVGRLGRYIIDMSQIKPRLIESKVVHDARHLWGMGLYANRDSQPDGQPVQQIRHLFWQSFGFWPELLSEFILERYRDYPYRMVPVEQVLAASETTIERPSSLLRVDTATMEIADVYEFPLRSQPNGSMANGSMANDSVWHTHIVSSPQFIPRTPPNPKCDPQLDGYILCTVVSQTAKELWLFDAAALHQGPICRLSHPDLDFGYTIHTAWLPQIQPRTAAYCISVQADYDPMLKGQPADIRRIFEQHIYSHFSSTRHS